MKEHFSLSADEIEELEYVVDKKLEGEEFAKQSRAVHRFVSNSSETTTPLCVVLPNGTSVEAFPEPIDQWKITLMNACHPNVINFFQKMVAQGASMDHYFFKPLDIEQIKNLLPILFLKQYRLWQREVGCRQHPSF